MYVAALEEWKKRDPLLRDLEGFERFLEAHELKRLIRLGSPSSHGEPFTRWQVMKAIEERGMQILEDLGWPSDWKSLYRSIHTGRVYTLEQVLKAYADGLDPLRREMHNLEEKLNELTNGEYYGGFAGRGLETYQVSELKKLAKKYEGPEFNEVLRRAVILHKGFYEKISGCLLTDDYVKNDVSCQNILKHSRWLGIPIEEPVLDSALPPQSYDSQLFWVLESHEPAE